MSKTETLKKLEPFNIEMIEQLDEGEELLKFQSKFEGSEVFGIPMIGNENFSEYFETFLVKMPDGSLYIFDTHYNKSKSLKKIKACSRDITGIWIDYDFEVETPEEHVEIHIPQGSMIFYFAPEYEKLIAFSPDFSHGISTVGFGNEPNVETLNPEVKKSFKIHERDEEEIDDDDSDGRFRGLFAQYDFVNSNM
jgi:hypothetical protein